MYLPAQFAESDPAQLAQVMHAHPLATLVTLTPQGLCADHIPLMLSAEEGTCGVLRGHVARANPLWQQTDMQTEVLAIFHSSDHYISPNWYPTKQEHGKAVPTWNYEVVHAYGQLQVKDDAKWLRAFLGQLTARHESCMAQPWKIEDAPPDYIEKTMMAIVGIEIVLSKVIGKAKVSQNQPAQNRQGVIQGLQEVNTEAALNMAAMVERKGG